MISEAHFISDSLLSKPFREPIESDIKTFEDIVSDETLSKPNKCFSFKSQKLTRKMKRLVYGALNYGKCTSINVNPYTLKRNAEVLRYLINEHANYQYKKLGADGSFSQYEIRILELLKILKRGTPIEKVCNRLLISKSEIEFILVTFTDHLRIFFSELDSKNYNTLESILESSSEVYDLMVKYTCGKFTRQISINEDTSVIKTGLPFKYINKLLLCEVFNVGDLISTFNLFNENKFSEYYGLRSFFGNYPVSDLFYNDKEKILKIINSAKKSEAPYLCASKVIA